MKKAWLILFLLVGLIFVSSPNAEIFYTANQITIAWDAVPPPVDSNNVPLPGVIKYQVYTKAGVPTATPQKAGNEITVTQALVTFQAEGKYWPCVETLRYPTGETEPQRSNRLACSDVAADVQNGVTFGAKYFVIPDVAKGLRKP